MENTVDLRRIVYALSDALDLVGIDDVAHGKRVAIMTTKLGEKLHLPQEENVFLFELGLLHDIGVSSTHVHGQLMDEFDWEGSQEHAHLGHSLLCDFAPLERMAWPIYYHHTKWSNLGSIEQHLARQANLILLADRIDALAIPYYANRRILEHKDTIRAAVASRSGEYFEPELVEVFYEISRSESFWCSLETHAIQYYLQEQLERNPVQYVGIDDLKQLARIFAHVVDAKSPFTAQHSLGVARLSRFLAEKMGVSAEHCDKIEIAGLLHDLGKLRIPDTLLEKPTKLDVSERLTMNTHAFETYLILRNIHGFDDITRWAAYHHEELDGSGYPFHVVEADIPIEARILRVADIFQAMSQNRPYRKGLDADAVKAFMAQLSQQGRVDKEVAAVVCACHEQAMQVALALE